MNVNQRRLLEIGVQIQEARELSAVPGSRQMAQILEEILPDTTRLARDHAVCTEASRLLDQMKQVREAEGDLALDHDGELPMLLAQYTYGEEGRRGRIQEQALEYLLVSARVHLSSPEQLIDFAQEILRESLHVEVRESLHVEVDVQRALESASVHPDGHSRVNREGARLSLIANWRNPIDEGKTVDEQWAAIKKRCWDLITRRRFLESFRELEGSRQAG